MSLDTRGRARGWVSTLLGWLVIGLTLATALWAASGLFDTISQVGWRGYDPLIAALFALSLIPLALTYWSVVIGFVLRLWETVAGGRPNRPSRLPRGRTAVLLPVYNEDPVRVFAGLEAMVEALGRTAAADRFSFFILSDSTNPACWVAEERAWRALSRRVGAGRVFYRHRPRNVARKAGNIAEFCRRWGNGFDHMLVLDADSLMTPEAMIRLARRMDHKPRAGLIQTVPRLIGARTPFARLAQFASAMYGPAFASGQALWLRENGNYWGHNAIIRVRAFMEACGLPELPGKPPFGGHILSHDFVEAALLRRAGWEVWLATDIEGSYEEFPPSLREFSQRDRRWCQGNLQHARIVAARGLHPVSRLHLLTGIMAYLSAPVWFAFLLAVLADALTTSFFPPKLFPEAHTLFPAWPRFDSANALTILGVSASLLFLPRFLALAWLALDRRLRGFGGALALAGGFLLETVLAALFAPALMVLQMSHVAGIVSGRDGGWNSQKRDGEGLSLGDCMRLCRLPFGFGMVLATVALLVGPPLAWWLMPLMLSLLISPFLAWLTASSSLGAWMQRHGIMAIPEERDPPAVMLTAEAKRAEWADLLGTVGDPIAALAADPDLRALHILLLATSGRGDPFPPQAVSDARSRFESGSGLTTAQLNMLLHDPGFVSGLGPSAMAA